LFLSCVDCGGRKRNSAEAELIERPDFELIADARRTTYSYDGRTLPLEVWPLDQFSFRRVPLPSPAVDAAQEKETK
ncbi:MAG TPA: hypothetical protein VF608_00665, partial [Thermoanaerobaculia bacterium]